MVPCNRKSASRTYTTHRATGLRGLIPNGPQRTARLSSNLGEQLIERSPIITDIQSGFQWRLDFGVRRQVATLQNGHTLSPLRHWNNLYANRVKSPMKERLISELKVWLVYFVLCFFSSYWVYGGIIDEQIKDEVDIN